MRKTAKYQVADEGRDKGKVFLITEMSAKQGEEWAMRALLALTGANVEIPEDFSNLGMAGLAQIGLRGLMGLHWETAKPLLDEMFTCVQIIPDPKKPHIARPLLDDDQNQDIEEILTRMKLRGEIWQLHAGFLKAVAPSLAGRAKAAAKSSSTETSAK